MRATTSRESRVATWLAGIEPRSNLGLFALVLPVGLLLHLTSERDWFVTPAHGLATVAAVALLLRPNSIVRLTTVAVAWVGVLAWELPRAFNHTVLLGVLLLAVPVAVALRAWRSSEDDLERRLFPYFRALVYVLFTFAVLHKLNSDYFTAAWSCAVEHMESLVDRAPLIPDAGLDGFAWLLIPGSLVVEAGIPILLAMRRTRWFGLALAYGFHYLNGLNGHWAFSGFALALYVPFLPRDTWRRVVERVRSEPGLARAAAALGLAVVAMPVVGLVAGSVAQKLGLAVFVLFAPLVFGLFLFESWGRHEAFTDSLAPWQWGLIGAVVLIGLSPYLGLGTRANLAMYSNLQTEGDEWNHLFMPSGLRIFDTQDHLIEMTDPEDAPFAEFLDFSDDKATRHQPTGAPRIVGWEFRSAINDYCATDPGTTPVSFRVDGRSVSVVDICADPEWSTAPPALFEKLFRYRIVDTPSVCRQ
jgi:hypothetical protein